MTESIPKGYQKTEIGIIPEDWEVKRLVDFLDYLQPTEFLVSNTEYNDTNSIPVLTAGKTFILGFTDEKYGIFKKLPVIIFDDFTTAIKFVDFPFKAKSSAMKMLVPKNDKVNLRFIYELMLRIKYPLGDHKRHWIGEYRYLEISVPKSTEEQQSIAQVLSDTDELIESLTKLIEKKKNIKQGAMQELLTGKKRLEGFSGEWEEKEFNKVAWFQEGPGLRNWQFTKSGMKVINVTNLENGYLNLDRTDRHISLEEFKRMYLHFEIDENDIVVASSGNSYAKVSLVRKKDLPLLMNTSVIRFKPLNNITFDFLFAFLKSPLFKNQIDLLITGGAQPNFGPYHLKKLKINMPLDKKEQELIGQTLSSMDSEIESLEAKRDKYINLKQGMMQELLTGRIRLKCQK